MQELKHILKFLSINFILLKVFTKGINHLAPKSDYHLISPHYILPESNMKVMRIEEMISN